MLRSKRVWFGIALVGTLAAWSAWAQTQYRQAPLPPDGSAPGWGNEQYSYKLGIYYTLVPYNGSGGNYNPVTGNYNPSQPPGYGGYPSPYTAPTYGARLTRYPVPNSPFAFLQFEPGDMIVSLDNTPIYGPNDLESHYSQTSVIFVNVRTGQPQFATVNLP